jgi:hypothetical protein
MPEMIFDGGVYPLAVDTHPGDLSPYGAYDMLGNAEEWVADWFLPDYYPRSPYTNPQGPEKGLLEYGHTVRGLVGDIVAKYGLVLRHFGGGFAGFRCAYTP